MKKELSAMSKLIGFAVILSLGIFSIIASGGGGGGGGGSGTVDTTAAAGLWRGTLTNGNNNTFNISGVVSTNGKIQFLFDEGLCEGTQYSGTFSMNGDAGSGNFTGYAAEGCMFSNGETLISGTFDFIVAGDDFTGTYSSVEGDSGTISLTYDPIAEVPITLAELQGNWGYYEGPGYFAELLVSSDGSFTGIDDSGCDYVGQISIIDPDLSITDVSMTASTCDDASINGTYLGLGLRFFEDGNEEFAILVSNSTNAGYDFYMHRFLRAELPCTDIGDDIACPTNNNDNDSGEFWGEVGASYDVTIRVRGIVEQKTYTGSSEVDGMWAKDGTPDEGTFNTYSLSISSPPQTYYLNYGISGIGKCFAIDFQKTLVVDEGATVELYAYAGGDDWQIHNQDSIGGNPIVIPDIPPAPDAFDGQFVQMDILSTVKK